MSSWKDLEVIVSDHTALLQRNFSYTIVPWGRVKFQLYNTTIYHIHHIYQTEIVSESN